MRRYTVTVPFSQVIEIKLSLWGFAFFSQMPIISNMSHVKWILMPKFPALIPAASSLVSMAALDIDDHTCLLPDT